MYYISTIHLLLGGFRYYLLDSRSFLEWQKLFTAHVPSQYFRNHHSFRSLIVFKDCAYSSRGSSQCTVECMQIAFTYFFGLIRLNNLSHAHPDFKFPRLVIGTVATAHKLFETSLVRKISFQIILFSSCII